MHLLAFLFYATIQADAQNEAFCLVLFLNMYIRKTIVISTPQYTHFFFFFLSPSASRFIVK